MESVETGANDAEVFRAIVSTKAARYFPFDFGHADGAFADVVREGNGRFAYT